MLRIAGGTVNQTPLDWRNNTQNIIQAIEEARKKKVNILCLPELCITGYGCEDLFLSDWLHQKALEQLDFIRQHCRDITVAVGLPLQIDGITYNGACLIENGKILGITCKQNLARDGVHYEPRWFNAWKPGEVKAIETREGTIPVGDIIYPVYGIRVGFEICEDGWSNNRPGYSLYDRGVDVILNPSASHFAMGKSHVREKKVVVDAAEKFRCTYVFTNLLGNEAGRMVYDGDILIAHKGKLLMQNKRLSFHNLEVQYCDIDFEDPSKNSSPVLYDERDRNEELTQAISLALFDYLRKSKARGFVLSLSGGADSGTCATLVAEMVKRTSAALGWDVFCDILHLDRQQTEDKWKKAVGMLLTCAYQATKNSSQQTFQAAKELANSIGASFCHWNVDDEIHSYTKKIEDVLGRSLTWTTDDVSLQNIQARARAPVIWLLANVKGAILLTTSNRSEGDVGYATMDGDTSGSLAPIAGLSKPFILQWLRWAEQSLNHDGLRLINTLQPTAELRPSASHQTDEDDLMPYAVLAEIERHAIFQHKSPKEVFELMSATHADKDRLKNHIIKFFRLWTANQWKRERLAPSFHVDDLNVDPRTWCRFPILSGGFAEELEELSTL